MDVQGSAGQNANGYKTIAVGPTRRLVLQAWIHGFSLIFRDLLDRVLTVIRAQSLFFIENTRELGRLCPRFSEFAISRCFV